MKMNKPMALLLMTVLGLTACNDKSFKPKTFSDKVAGTKDAKPQNSDLVSDNIKDKVAKDIDTELMSPVVSIDFTQVAEVERNNPDSEFNKNIDDIFILIDVSQKGSEQNQLVEISSWKELIEKANKMNPETKKELGLVQTVSLEKVLETIDSMPKTSDDPVFNINIRLVKNSFLNTTEVDAKKYYASQNSLNTSLATAQLNLNDLENEAIMIDATKTVDENTESFAKLIVKVSAEAIANSDQKDKEKETIDSEPKAVIMPAVEREETPQDVLNNED